jgi:integrase
MSRSTSVPRYRLHKHSGRAVVTLPDGLGNRRDVWLGKYGSSESRAEYARVIAEWEANGRRLPQAPVISALDLTITELIARFWPYAEQHYRRPDGTTTNELLDFKYSLRPLAHLYGHTPAREFSPLALKAVRQKMVEGYEHPRYGPQKPLCRGVINQRIGRIRSMFKWAVENELVPASVLLGLQAVRGLQQGRSEARETEPVKPVPPEHVEAVVPHVRPPVAAMLQLQLLTAMRPGEVVIMRAIDLDMTSPVWLYRPGSDQGRNGTHKTAHRGQDRVIAIGPRGQEIIRQWLKPDLYAYLFSPRETMNDLRRRQRRERTTKLRPSQRQRRKKRPKRKPGGRYRVGSYNYAVVRACAKIGVPPFHVHQLRHNAATEVRKTFGLDAARALLGHRSSKVTEVYAEVDMRKALEVAAQIG